MTSIKIEINGAVPVPFTFQEIQIDDTPIEEGCVIVYNLCEYRGNRQKICTADLTRDLVAELKFKVRSVRFGRLTKLYFTDNDKLEFDLLEFDMICSNEQSVLNYEKYSAVEVQDQTTPLERRISIAKPDKGCILFYSSCQYRGYSTILCFDSSSYVLTDLINKFKSIRIDPSVNLFMWSSKNKSKPIRVLTSKPCVDLDKEVFKFVNDNNGRAILEILKPNSS
jgi:hypothetical protein